MNLSAWAVCALFLATTPVAAAIRSDGPALQVESGDAPVRPVRIDAAALRAGAVADRLELPSTGAAPLIARDVEERRRADGLDVWTGTIDTRFGPQSFVLTLGDGVAFGTIPQFEGHPLRIETRRGEIVAVEGPVEPAFTESEPDFVLPPAPSADSRAKRRRQESIHADGDPVVDVLMLYTPRFVAVWGSHDAAMARLAYLEELANQAYADSLMATRVRVVARHLVDHTAADDNDIALYLLSGEPANAPLHVEATRLRTLYGADLVALVREASRNVQTSCGVGWLGGWAGGPFEPGQGFSVSADRGFDYAGCEERVFAHEVGHNLGAHHDIETAHWEDGAYPYSHGLRQTLGDTGFATIMAYRQHPQVIVARFSNPRQSDCLGQPCGNDTVADNARGIDEASPTVAGFLPAAPDAGEPTLAVGDATVVEGADGEHAVRFTLTLSGPAPAAVAVAVATMPGSATSGDFVPAQFTVQIPAGETAADVDVLVRGDADVEGDEVFALNVMSAPGVRIADGQGVATIVDDETPPTLSFADVAVTEGDDGIAAATFIARLSAPSADPVSFSMRTHEYLPHQTAHPASVEYDYLDVRATRLTIPAGQTSATFAVPIVGDTYAEPPETFYVLADEVVGALQGDTRAIATIFDDDAPDAPVLPTISIADVAVPEGDAGTAAATFTVTLSAPAAAEVRFGVATRDVSAFAGLDFVGSARGSLVIPAGATETTVTVGVRGDLLDENDEFFVLDLLNVRGADVADGSARGTIADDEGDAPVPVLAARDDRWVLRESSGPATLAILANDEFDAGRLAGGSVTLIEAPVRGTASVEDGGTVDPADDVVVYVPDAGASGDDVLAYRLCEGGGRCVDAMVAIVLRPHVGATIDVTEDGGFHDLPMQATTPMQGATFRAITPVLPASDVLALGVDASPGSPWDGADGTAFIVREVPPYYDVTFIWTYVYPRNARLLVDAQGEAGDVDLYVGIDDNRNGRPDPAELDCTSAMSTARETCELALYVPTTPDVAVWVMAHNRGTTGTDATVSVYDLDQDETARMDATGPAILDAGDDYLLRTSWTTLPTRPGVDTLSYVGVNTGDGSPRRWFPVRLSPAATVEALPQPLQESAEQLTMAPGETVRKYFVDVPAGASTFTVYTYVPGIEVRFARGTTSTTPRIDIPSAEDTVVSMFALGSQGRADLDVAQHGTGRWHVTFVNPGANERTLLLRTELVGAAPVAPLGSWFNPDRSGHGLMLYPAADQWVGLWYTYFQDGTPTWYYLQAKASSYEYWKSTIYRSSWSGTANVLTAVGTAWITAAPDGLLMTYRLDGEIGAERLVALGSGCPMLDGSALDVSSHWFNPARSGTGYSVQMWPDYEFHAAFVYDDRGVPRFLTAERSGFGGADAILALEQLQGFCPLCERDGAPQRSDVGTLRRRFEAGTFAGMELDAIWTGGVPGAWTANEAVQPLGGAGTTQGCASLPPKSPTPGAAPPR